MRILNRDGSLKITVWSSNHNPWSCELILLDQFSRFLIVSWAWILRIYFRPMSLSVGLEHEVLLVSHLHLKRVHWAEFALLDMHFLLTRSDAYILLHLILPLILRRLVVSLFAPKPSRRRCLLNKTCVWIVVARTQLVRVDVQEVFIAIESGYFSWDTHGPKLFLVQISTANTASLVGVVSAHARVVDHGS